VYAPPPLPPPSPSFSWGKALVHVVLVAGGLIGITLILAATGKFPDAGKAGEIAGQFSVWIAILTVVASFGFQTGRTWLGALATAATAGVLGLTLFTLLRFSSISDVFQPFTEGERDRPHRQADGTVCQAPLGFSFPSPGPGFEPAPALEQQLNQTITSQNLLAWAYESTQTGERILIQAGKGAGRETTFRAFTRGIESSLRKQPTMTVQTSDLRWEDQRKDYRLLAAVQNGVFLNLRCVSSGTEGRPNPLVVCLQTVSREPAGYQQTRDGLVIGPCGG
jgi:hypothetical protein